MTNPVAKAKIELKSLSWFFLASISASVLNYLFHVVAARRIGAEAFAQFSVEWSYLSLTFIGGAFVLYFSTWNGLSRQQKRVLMIGLQILAFLAFALVWVSGAVMIENLMQSFLLGFCLRRKDYATVNLLNLSLAVVRILLLLALPASMLDTPGILRAVFLSFVIVQFVYLLLVRGTAPDDDLKSETKIEWLAPSTLAVISGLIPQIDVLWTAKFWGGEALLRMSEMALVSKGVFFLQMIFAQWMLPLEQKRIPTVLQTFLGLIGIAAASAVMGTTAAYILPVVLNWTTPLSSEDFVKISMVGMSSSLFYMLVQISCKRAFVLVPIVGVLILLGQAVAQGYAGFSLNLYLWLTILTYAILSLSLTAALNQAARSRLSRRDVA